MKPSFFGNRGRPLYGVVASPKGSSRDGVVLCYPALQEYNQSHWVFRRLHAQLVRAGLHAMRFDYFGTGDSGGEVEDGTMAGWVSDIRTAMEELEETAGVRSLSLVGMGLGAALAVRASHSLKVPLRELVLWNPVLAGGVYIDQLFRKDDQENLQLLHAERGSQRDELLGYVFTRSLRVELSSLDLLQEPPPKAKRVHVFSSAASPNAELYAAGLTRAGIEAQAKVVEEEGGTNEGAREAANLSSRILSAITEALTPEVAKRPA